MSAWSLLVLGAGMVAAVWDWRTRRIPRWLTVPAFFVGLAHAGLTGMLTSSLAAAGLGLGLGLMLLQLDAFGGGDAKWLAATGALLGWHLWWWSVSIAMIAAAVWALAQLAARNRLWFLASDLGAIARGWRERGLKPHPEHRLANPAMAAAPFGVAMGIGLAWALLLR